MRPPLTWVIAGLVALGIGAAYYSPSSPTGRYWMSELKKQNPRGGPSFTPETCVAITAVCNVVLTGILCQSHDFRFVLQYEYYCYKRNSV